MKIQLDTNIVIDILEQREPFYKVSSTLIITAIQQNHDLCITANSIDNIHYILKSNKTVFQIENTIQQFLEFASIASVNEKIITLALKAGWKDLEDAIQYFTAIEAGANLIVTRD